MHLNLNIYFWICDFILDSNVSAMSSVVQVKTYYTLFMHFSCTYHNPVYNEYNNWHCCLNNLQLLIVFQYLENCRENTRSFKYEKKSTYVAKTVIGKIVCL